jgi:hypothetical protein
VEGRGGGGWGGGGGGARGAWHECLADGLSDEWSQVGLLGEGGIRGDRHARLADGLSDKDLPLSVSVSLKGSTLLAVLHM